MIPQYLGPSAFAKHAGLKAGTINSYFRKGMLPEPDIYYLTYEGERPGWSIDTVEHWMNNRPGSGRTYASMKRHNSSSHPQDSPTPQTS